MTFRTYPKGSLWQIAYALCWILFCVLQLRHHFRYHSLFQHRFYGVLLVFLATILLLHLYFLFFSTVEVAPASLRLHIYFRPVAIPYSSIVAVTPARDAKGAVKRNTIEIEIAKLRPDIYPHTYKELHLTDPDAFLTALQPHILTQP